MKFEIAVIVIAIALLPIAILVILWLLWALFWGPIYLYVVIARSFEESWKPKPKEMTQEELDARRRELQGPTVLTGVRLWLFCFCPSASIRKAKQQIINT